MQTFSHRHASSELEMTAEWELWLMAAKMSNICSKPIWSALAKVDPTLFNPKSMRTKQYVPHGVMNEVFSSSSLDIKIWWYPEYASRKESKSHPDVESTIWSMRSKGKGSCGHALLRSVKSMHILHFPLAFFTITVLASHSGYVTSLITSALRSLFTSFRAPSALSSDIFRTLCFLGLKDDPHWVNVQ